MNSEPGGAAVGGVASETTARRPIAKSRTDTTLTYPDRNRVMGGVMRIQKGYQSLDALEPEAGESGAGDSQE